MSICIRRGAAHEQATAPAHSQTECVVCVSVCVVRRMKNLAAGALTTFCTAQASETAASAAGEEVEQLVLWTNHNDALRLSTALTHPPPGQDEIK
jgi:hypothetical protein